MGSMLTNGLEGAMMTRSAASSARMTAAGAVVESEVVGRGQEQGVGAFFGLVAGDGE